MKNRIMMALIALGLVAAANASEPARIAFVKPAMSKSGVVMDPGKYLKLVVEGPLVSHEKNMIPEESLVEYVDTVLKTKDAAYLAIYVREGSKYGDVMRALDSLRKTAANDIAVNMVEVAAGRDV